jgi:2-iminobutanoate/2-iminopropanoate deaminase
MEVNRVHCQKGLEADLRGGGTVKAYRNPANIHPPVAAYTHQIEISGSERWLALSGQVGRRLDGKVPEDPVEQLSVALDNISRNLQAANMEVSDLVKLTFYLVGDMDAIKRGEVISAKLKGHRPCMTLLFVASLATPFYKVEVDAWASRAD